MDDHLTQDELYWYCDRCDENSKRLNAANEDEEESKEEIEPDDDNTKRDDDDNETDKDLLEDENDDKSNISSDYEIETIFYREPNEPQYQCNEFNFTLCTKCYNLCKKCYNL